jgi:Flp pilus assembly protein TadG
MKLHDSKRKLNSTNGQATVEFALILIVLLAVLYGIIEISRLLFINVQIENAAREGAHYIALHPLAKTCVKEDVIRPMLSGMDTSDDRVSVNASTQPFQPSGVPPLYSALTVTVTYRWESLVNFMPNMKTFTLEPLGPFNLSSTSTSLIETADRSQCAGK